MILDDVVNDIRKNKGVDKLLAKILYNRRHITADGGDEANGVSVWLTTQSYNRIPLMIGRRGRRRGFARVDLVVVSLLSPAIRV